MVFHEDLDMTKLGSVIKSSYIHLSKRDNFDFAKI